MTGYPAFRVSIPWVLVGIRGYPFPLAPQGSKKLLPKSGGCVGFSWVSGGSFGGIRGNSSCFCGYPGCLWSNHLQMTGCVGGSSGRIRGFWWSNLLQITG